MCMTEVVCAELLEMYVKQANSLRSSSNSNEACNEAAWVSAGTETSALDSCTSK